MTSRPPIVCLCGSTRFIDTFLEEQWRLTLEGKIVLSVGVLKHGAPDHAGEALGEDVARRLDELHLRKIDLADEVRILNVGGYIGDSTFSELAYARRLGKHVTFLEPPVALDRGEKLNQDLLELLHRAHAEAVTDRARAPILEAFALLGVARAVSEAMAPRGPWHESERPADEEYTIAPGEMVLGGSSHPLGTRYESKRLEGGLVRIRVWRPRGPGGV